MHQTYTQRYKNGGSSDMTLLMSVSGEDPTFLGADDQGNELYGFSDNVEVILTNAGTVHEGEDEFDEVRATILSR